MDPEFLERMATLDAVVLAFFSICFGMPISSLRSGGNDSSLCSEC
jgi:hypothetical protein